MTTLDKNQILSSEDRPTKVVPVPQWGGDITIKKLSAKQNDVRRSFWRYDSKGSITEESFVGDGARLVCLAAINADGSQMFTIEEHTQLLEKDSSAVDLVAVEVRKLCGFLVEDPVKNSPETPDESGS